MNNRVCILGSGSSGQAAARLLASVGRSGWVCAERDPTPEMQRAFENCGFSYTARIPEDGLDFAVISPGFAMEHPWLQVLRARGISLVPEFELGAGYLQGKTVAVTGSLGKTTMVLFAMHLLRQQGLRVTCSGNIGTPTCEVALKSPVADVHVLELSSFQTEAATGFRPDVGVWLNLFPNHLDRHGSMDAYAGAKARMFAFQTPADFAVLPEGVPVAVPGRGRRRVPEPARVPETRGTGFDHPALRENLAALLTGLGDWDFAPEQIRAAMETFAFPPFRMQEIGTPKLGRVINDSKSTCLSATRAALRGVDGPVHLIMGGVPKGDDPGMLKQEFREKTVYVYLYGECAAAYASAWRAEAAQCEVHEGLRACLDSVFRQRNRTESLLFSPGCASFDQYMSYEARGRHFQKLVHARDQEFFLK